MNRAERRARRLLEAYPWRVRREQGDEIVGTALDALPAGAARLPVRDQVDLVRGGLRVRAQRRPPWPTVLAYSLGFRIHPRWIWWVFDDLENPRYVQTRRAWTALVWAVVMSALALAFGDPTVVLFGVGGLVGGLAGVPRERERARARHGLVDGGSDPSVTWTELHRGALVPNTNAADVLLAVGGGLLAGCTATVLALVGQDPTSAPAGWAERLAVTIHPAETTALRPAAIAGTVLALPLVVLASVRVRSLGRRAASPPAADRRSAAVALAGVALAALAAAPALPLHWRWLPGAYAAGAVVVAIPAAVVVLGALVLVVVGRRRGSPVGIWELLPRLAARTTVRPVARWMTPRR